MSAITLLIHLVGGILGGLKVGRENNFFLVFGLSDLRKENWWVRMFFFLSSSKRNLFKFGKNNRRKSVAKMLKKKKAHDTSSMMIYCATFFFLVWLFHFSFLFPKVGASRKCTACTFFGFLKNWARLFFIFCLLICLFSF